MIAIDRKRAHRNFACCKVSAIASLEERLRLTRLDRVAGLLRVVPDSGEG